MILIGPLPPPIHGASEITKRVAEMLVADKVSVVTCNTSPPPGATGISYHLGRAKAYFRCCRSVLRTRQVVRRRAVYLSLSGGFGLIYDLVVVAVSRLRRCVLIFHHHSFAYITAPSRLMRAIVRVAGASQIHIVLCPTMAMKLCESYSSSLKIAVISNLVFLEVSKQDVRRPATSLASIGYLSNISFDKGIDRYLDLLAALRAEGSGVAGVIAGPFSNGIVREYVERRMQEIGGIACLGPVYGERKASFFSSIDLLVFPTRYANEAQPLVVYEAQAAGIPVAASERGCLAQMGGPNSMLLLDPTASDLEPLVEQILRWEKDPKSFEDFSQHLQEEFGALLDQRVADTARFRALFSGYRAALDVAPPR